MEKRNRKPYRLTDLLLWVCQRHFELLLLLEIDVNCDPTHPRSSYDLIWITWSEEIPFSFYVPLSSLVSGAYFFRRFQ